MEAGCFRAVDVEEAVDDGSSGVVEGGVQGPSCLSRPETQEGWTTTTPPPFEEPSSSSWGQEEASKLYRNRSTKRRVLTITYITFINFSNSKVLLTRDGRQFDE